MTSYAIRRGDAVRYMSVPAGAFAARYADSRGRRPWKHLDLRQHARTPALRLGQRRITEAENLPCHGWKLHGGQLAGAAACGHLRSTWSLPERLAELLSGQLRQHRLQPSDCQADSTARHSDRPDRRRAGDLRSRRAARLHTGRRHHRRDRPQAAAGRRLRREGPCLRLPVAGAQGDHRAAARSCCCSARRTSSPSSGRTPPCSYTPPILLCPDLRSGRRECVDQGS